MPSIALGAEALGKHVQARNYRVALTTRAKTHSSQIMLLVGMVVGTTPTKYGSSNIGGRLTVENLLQ